MSAAGTTRLCRATTDEAIHNQITTTQGFSGASIAPLRAASRLNPFGVTYRSALTPPAIDAAQNPGKNPKKWGVDRPRSFRNVRKVLSAAGATFDDVVDMVTYHTDARDLELFIKVKDRYFTNLERLPTWTAIGVSFLAMPGLFAEIKCTALLPD